MLIKLDDQQLGWMASDRARVLASGGGDALAAGEAARNLAVLARKAGWHEQASSITLSIAASPLLVGPGTRLAAERGLLIQSAAYTAARAGDRDRMRELTDEAASIAAQTEGRALLRDHGGGFSPATVELHRVSAENYAGDPGAAVAAALRIVPASLPTTERRARYWTDTARPYANWGRAQGLRERAAGRRAGSAGEHGEDAQVLSQEAINPVMYLADGDRYLVFASKAGSDRNPDWYWNLKANLDVTIEVGDETIAVRATELTGAERDEKYRIQSERYPGFAACQQQNSRTIPVVVLKLGAPQLTM